MASPPTARTRRSRSTPPRTRRLDEERPSAGLGAHPRAPAPRRSPEQPETAVAGHHGLRPDTPAPSSAAPCMFGRRAGTSRGNLSVRTCPRSARTHQPSRARQSPGPPGRPPRYTGSTEKRDIFHRYPIGRITSDAKSAGPIRPRLEVGLEDGANVAWRLSQRAPVHAAFAVWSQTIVDRLRV